MIEVGDNVLVTDVNDEPYYDGRVTRVTEDKKYAEVETTLEEEVGFWKKKVTEIDLEWHRIEQLHKI